MTTLLTLLLAASTAAAAADGPPPYPESLKCAAYSQAAAELTADPATGLPKGKAFDHAMFWSFAVMDAARRAGVTAADAEAAQDAERARVKPLVIAGDPAAKATLQACLDLVPR